MARKPCAKRHPCFQRARARGLDAGVLAPQGGPHAAAFGEEGAEILLRDLLHRRSPREFGKQTSLWTLEEDAAEISFEQEGLTPPRRVTGETIRATLKRLGVRWERAKRWIESPDPEYARKKGLFSRG